MTKSLQSAAYKQSIAVLIEARRRSGLTQQKVADALGKPQSYVAKIERCERRLDIVEFVALANAVSADPCGLFANVVDQIKVSFDGDRLKR